MASTSLLLPGPRSLVKAGAVRTDLKLLEVSNDILSTLVNDGMVIKGIEDDEAVICSRTRTYALKHFEYLQQFVETTNTLLLIQPEEQCGQMEVDNDVGGRDNDHVISSAPGLQTQVQQLQEGAARLPPVTVYATSKAHIEVVEVAPRLQPLHELLAERPYSSEEEEGTQGPGAQPQCVGDDTSMACDQGGTGQGCYTLDQLLERVQASEGEVLAELEESHALQLDGCWRSVDPGYLGNLLELVILSAQAEGMSLHDLQVQQLVDVLVNDGIRPELTRHCLHIFGSSTTTSSSSAPAGNAANTDDQAAQTWALDDRKVCIHFAEKLLRTPCPATLDAPGDAGGVDARRRPGAASEKEVLGWSSPYVWPQSAFMLAWSQAVPAGIQPDMAMLAGEVITEGKGSAATVQLFSVRYMPPAPRDRFHALFTRRPRWEASALDPFLAGLKAPGKTAGALLLQYARVSQPTPESPVCYTRRD